MKPTIQFRRLLLVSALCILGCFIINEIIGVTTNYSYLAGHFLNTILAGPEYWGWPMIQNDFIEALWAAETYGLILAPIMFLILHRKFNLKYIPFIFVALVMVLGLLLRFRMSTYPAGMQPSIGDLIARGATYYPLYYYDVYDPSLEFLGRLFANAQIPVIVSFIVGCIMCNGLLKIKQKRTPVIFPQKTSRN